jgi:hypothetical protein
MDPRLNPNLALSSPRTMQDIKPIQRVTVQSIEGPNPPPPDKPLTNPPIRPDDNVTNNAADTPAHANTPAITQVVESIPLREPEQLRPMMDVPPMNSATLTQMPGYGNPREEPQDELEKILQAVNNRVAAPINPNSSKPKAQIFKKVLSTTSTKAKGARRTSRPILAMTVVVFVALTLSAVAIFAYKQGSRASPLVNQQPGKVGTSYVAGDAIQAAGGTLVRPSDLDDYSQSLQQSLNALNDKQDFDPGSLSDAVLGL